MLVFATVDQEAGVEPYELRFCLMVFHFCDYLLPKISDENKSKIIAKLHNVTKMTTKLFGIRL